VHDSSQARTVRAASAAGGTTARIKEPTMTFELDHLIAIAFIAPVAFFAVLNIVAFRTRGYDSAVKPFAAVGGSAVETGPATANVVAEAANDGEFREAA
jgi:hypothetical protein